MRPYFFIQTRMRSTRFPGKALAEVREGVPLVAFVHERLRASRWFDPERVWFLTSDQPADDRLAAVLAGRGWHVRRGDEARVLDRFRAACEESGARWFYRICADNPFLDAGLLDALAGVVPGDLAEDGAPGEGTYVSHRTSAGTPVIRTGLGFFGELVSAPALLAGEAGPEDLEHVTPRLYREPARGARWLPVPPALEDPAVRLTVDHPRDLEITREIAARLPDVFDIHDVYRVIRGDPSLLERMRQVGRAEGES